MTDMRYCQPGISMSDVIADDVAVDTSNDTILAMSADVVVVVVVVVVADVTIVVTSIADAMPTYV